MKVVRILATAFAVATPLSVAAAADIPVEGAIYQPRPVAVIFRWTGVYVGLHGGGGGGFKQETSQPFFVPSQFFALPPGSTPPILYPFPTRIDMSGGIAGGQIGVNYQTDWLVIGLEAQASWANLKGSTACAINAAPTPPLTAAGANCTSKIDALGTLAGRLGVAFDRLLLFGKAGAAWTNDNYQMLINVPPAAFVFSTNELRWGWMLGIGAEYAFTDNWSAKIEYDYMDLGTHAQRFTDALSGSILIDTDIRERLNIVKVGVNYRFGVNPILLQ
jgi:outer membrane immunogenic protein